MTQQARMPAPGINPDAVSYVAQVRAALADLSPDDLDDLTGGMAADLAELLRERGGALTDHLGTPAAYAAELRAAAGLPTPGAAKSFRGYPAAIRRMLATARADNSIVDQTVRYVISLRSAWWFIRGAIAAGVLVAMVGLTKSPPRVLVAAVLVLLGAGVSIVVGVRRSSRAASGLGVLLNSLLVVIAVMTGINGLVTAFNYAFPRLDFVETVTASSDPPPPTNVIRSSNLFVYDSAGKRVDAARVFTAEGDTVRARHVGPGPGVVTEPLTRVDIYGVPVPEAYPEAAPGEDPWAPRPGSAAPWTPPASLPPLAPLAEPTPSAGAPGAVPSATPAPTPPVPGTGASTTPAPAGSVATKPSAPAATVTPTKSR